jgi:dTDP-4-amino-4,6-dideoxygalactose transaminase
MRAGLAESVRTVLEGGAAVLGPAVQGFEQEFARWCGAKHAVGVGSGTDAISLALLAVGVDVGDEVIVPANTCVPTIAGIEGAGAVPVLADVDPVTLTLDPSGVSAAVSDKTHAVLPVHLYGQTADMEGIRNAAADHGLRVVEDAAQAHGATFDGGRSGTLADAAAFSFYPTKNLGAFGDGGAVVTNLTEVAEKIRMLRNYGVRERDFAVLHGRNSRLDELQAAMLSVKLPNLDEWNARRTVLADRYLADLACARVQLPEVAVNRGHAWHLFAIRVRGRDQFRAVLAEAGVQTLVHYPRPIHHHPAYQHLVRSPGGLSVSERACEEVVSLPLYPELTDGEQRTVIEAVRAAVP